MGRKETDHAGSIAMSAYYNEFDPKMAQWCRELIKQGLIADGEVDERSIVDVKPSDLDGFTQCHFFAGIGGWSYALRLAGMPDDREVWTGSCPCQPFSVAGKGEGTSDERHLWPAFRWLIAQCRPATIFGEQVASADGREWLAGVHHDLEAMGYVCGVADLCAASIGTPNIRQRLWWVAHGERERGRSGDAERGDAVHVEPCSPDCKPDGDPKAVDYTRTVWWPCRDGKARRVPARWSADGGLPDAEHDGSPACDGNGGEAESQIEESSMQRQSAGGSGLSVRPTRASGDGGLPDAAGGQRQQLNGSQGDGIQRPSDDCNGRFQDARHDRLEVEPSVQRVADGIPEGVDGGGLACDAELFPLAEGVKGRVGLLKGYGNAINPQVAAVFIEAAME